MKRLNFNYLLLKSLMLITSFKLLIILFSILKNADLNKKIGINFLVRRQNDK